MGAVTEHHHSFGYTIVTVIAAHLFLLELLPESMTPPSSKVQVTLPPGPIQVGPERVYRHLP